MQPPSFDAQHATAWSRWVLAHGLPTPPGVVADGASVPVSCWRGPDSAAVLHVRRRSDDDDAQTEVDVEVFALVGGSWDLLAGGGAGGWAHPGPRRAEVDADHADLTGAVSGVSGDLEVVALWGEVGSAAAVVEVEQEQVVTRHPVPGRLGWVVVSALVRGRTTARIRDAAGRVLTEEPVEPSAAWDGPGR